MKEEKIAKLVSELSTDLGFYIQRRREFVSSRREGFPQSHLVHAMALSLLAAHEIIHDGGNKSDFLSIAEIAWDKSKEKHKECKEKI